MAARTGRPARTGVRGRRPWSVVPSPDTARLGVGSSGTSTCQPLQAFPHERPGPSFVRSVHHRGHPRVLVDPCRQPHQPSSPAGATSGPEAGHRHAGATGSIPQAPPDCWKSSTCDATKSRPSWLWKGRTIYKRPPGGARQPSPASAGRSQISRRTGRPAARPERGSGPGTPRPPRSSRPPRRDHGSGRGTGKEDLGLSGRDGRVPGTRQNLPGVAGGREGGRDRTRASFHPHERLQPDTLEAAAAAAAYRTQTTRRREGAASAAAMARDPRPCLGARRDAGTPRS